MPRTLSRFWLWRLPAAAGLLLALFFATGFWLALGGSLGDSVGGAPPPPSGPPPAKAVSGAPPVFEPGTPQLLFDARVPAIPAGFNWFPYAVAADGMRFLLMTSGSETAGTPLTVETNWLAGLKR